MACACQGRGKKFSWVWTGLDQAGQQITQTYSSEIQAKAKVIRDGGSYARVEKAAR